jgi:hypothetical protein
MATRPVCSADEFYVICVYYNNWFKNLFATHGVKGIGEKSVRQLVSVDPWDDQYTSKLRTFRDFMEKTFEGNLHDYLVVGRHSNLLANITRPKNSAKIMNVVRGVLKDKKEVSKPKLNVTQILKRVNPEVSAKREDVYTALSRLKLKTEVKSESVGEVKTWQITGKKSKKGAKHVPPPLVKTKGKKRV